MSKMKYAIVIPDGFADDSIESLGGKTPMEFAKTPCLDSLAPHAKIGRSHNVPDAFSPGSDVATLSLLGYNPAEVYTGRAPLEAVAQGIETGPDDWTFRCNLVCLAEEVMKDFTAGHISTEDATDILQTLNEVIAPRWNQLADSFSAAARGTITFYPGVSYRNLMVYRPATASGAKLFDKIRTFPPHDYTDQNVLQALPQGEGSEIIRSLMTEIETVLANHPTNLRRRADGKLPATNAWLWGQGKRPNIKPFETRFPGIRGAMITAVDLLRGIATSLGWDLIDVPNITGYVDTDYAAKGQYAAAALDRYDVVCVHVEATDEAGHEGSLEKKIGALEDIDAKVLPPILAKLQSFSDWRLLVSPDHPTPVRLKTHSRGYVPWLMAGSDIHESRPGRMYNEKTAADSPIVFEQGWEMIKSFFE